MLLRHRTPEVTAVSLLKLEKTGGTSLASTIVSSCVAHHCADKNCTLSFAATSHACGQHAGAVDYLDSWQTCRVPKYDTSPLAAAFRHCQALPLLVNKATTDLFARSRSPCHIAPQPMSWDAAQYRNLLVMLREPIHRLLSALYYFNGRHEIRAMGGQPVRTVIATNLTLNAMHELVSPGNRHLWGPDPVWQLGGTDASKAVGRAEYLLASHCVVGLTERLDATRALISLRLGLSVDTLVSCTRKRVGDTAHAAPLSADVHTLVEESFAPELALYDRARAIHTAQVASYSFERFSRTVAHVQEAQHAFSTACTKVCVD